MTAQETNKILAMILEVYPAFGKDRNPELTSKLWARLFEDEPYEWVEKALLAFIASDTKGFPPTPGCIKDKIQQLTGTEEPTEMEAWNMVVKAVSNSGWCAKEEFDKLPREIQEIVGSPSILRDWGMMDIDEFQTVVASNFQRSYRARAESRRVYGVLPTSIRISLPKYQEEQKKLAGEIKVLEEGKVDGSSMDYQYTEMPQSLRDIIHNMMERVEA